MFVSEVAGPACRGLCCGRKAPGCVLALCHPIPTANKEHFVGTALPFEVAPWWLLHGAGAIKGDVDTAASSKPLVPSSHTWAGSIAWGQTVIPSAGHADPPLLWQGWRQ